MIAKEDGAKSESKNVPSTLTQGPASTAVRMGVTTPSVDQNFTSAGNFKRGENPP